MASLASQGRAIAYVVKNMSGETDMYKTWQLAEYLAGYPFYERLIMDYYTGYTIPDVGLRVFVVLPELDESYNGNWARQKETRWNGQLQSRNLLLLL